MWYPISDLSVTLPEAAPRAFTSRAPAGPATFKALHVSQTFLSAQLAAKLGVGGYGGGSVTAESLVLVYEAMLFTGEQQDVDIDGSLWRARYGAGARVEVSVSKVDASVKADIYSVALQSTMNSVDAGFRITLPGITDPEIVKLVPGPGPFNFDSYQEILKSVDMVREKMASGKLELAPVLTHAYMGPAPRSADLTRSQALVFGVRMVADGKTPQDARSSALDRRISPIVVEAVYQHFAPGILDDQKPSKETRRAAERWLDTDELIQR